jgi:hypothetical protein
MNLTEGNDSYVGKQCSGFMPSSWNDTQETGSGESLTDGQIQQGSDPYRSIGDFYYIPLMTFREDDMLCGPKIASYPGHVP